MYTSKSRIRDLRQQQQQLFEAYMHALKKDEKAAKALLTECSKIKKVLKELAKRKETNE